MCPFVSKFTMKNKGIDKKIVRSQSKESKISVKFGKIDFKESKGKYISRGYVATDHVDKVGDKIMKETLDKWAKEINDNSNLDANVVSIHHDRDDVNLAGLGSEAKVEALPDGHYGLWVETDHNVAHPDFDDTSYQIDKNFLTHYSVEYNTHDGDTTHRENIDGEWIRVLEPETDFLGYGLASPRTVVNKNAEIVENGYKELFTISKKPTEVTKMEKKEEEAAKPAEEVKPEAEEKKVEETPKEEPKEEPKAEEPKAEAPAEEAKEEVKESLKKQILAEIKEDLEKAIPKNRPELEKKEKIETKEKVECKEVIDFKESLSKGTVGEQWNAAKKVEAKLIKEGKEIKNGSQATTSTPFEIKEGKMEYKTLTTDSNPAYSTDGYYTAVTTYTQTPTEFNDIYGPVIINQLNDMTTSWNLLQKVDMSGDSAIRFKVRDTANSTATGTNSFQNFGSTPTWDGNVGRTKYAVPFVTSYGEVQVEDEEMELTKATGGMGDVYADEVKWTTKDLMSALNSYMLTGSAAVAENRPYGFQKTIVTTGSLYGRALSSYALLTAAGYDNMSSAPITLKKCRDMIDASEQAGASKDDLVFIGNHTQITKIVTLIQAMQRVVPTSARVGFTGVLEIDGVPLYKDKDASTDDLFLIDMAHTKIGIKKAPTYVEFGKVSMHRRGIIWLMYNLYCTAPSHNYWIYGLLTT